MTRRRPQEGFGAATKSPPFKPKNGRTRENSRMCGCMQAKMIGPSRLGSQAGRISN